MEKEIQYFYENQYMFFKMADAVEVRLGKWGVGRAYF